MYQLCLLGLTFSNFSGQCGVIVDQTFHNFFEPCWVNPDQWPLCTNYVWIISGWKYPSVSSIHYLSNSKLSKTSGQKIQWKSPKNLTSLFKGITTSIYLITFNLTFSPQFTSTNWFEQLQHNWSHSSQIWQVSGFFSENITLFSIQQFNASAHCPCAHSHNPSNF